MGIRYSLSKINKKITEPKFVKLSTTLALIVAATSIITGVIVAMIGPPGGYNIIDNYISDLGGSPFTPFPYFLDIASIVSGILLIPTLFYIERLLVPRPENAKDIQTMSRSRKLLGVYWIIWMVAAVTGFMLVRVIQDLGIITTNQGLIYYYIVFPSLLWLSGLAILFIPISKTEEMSRIRIRLGNVASGWILVGVIGWFFVGVFSEDRSTAFGLHFWASILCFSGLALGGFFFGLVITFYDTVFPKFLGLYTIIVPTIMCVVLISTHIPLIEWIFFFSVFGWMIPGFILLIKNIDEWDNRI